MIELQSSRFPKVASRPVATPAPAIPTAAPSLDVLEVFLERLDAEGIRYCHWKSNEHVGPALTGRGDLDVLVDRRAALATARLLSEHGFKRFLVQPGLGYPGIEDYLGFDSTTGALTHLHLHYQLTLGEKFLKGHRLPWESVMLATRVYDVEHRIHVADPALEALLLLVRAAMKLRTRDFLLAGANTPYVRGSQLRELRWLAERTDPSRLQAIAVPLVGEEAARLAAEMLAVPAPTIRQLLAFRRCARPRWGEYRMYGALEARGRRWLRELGTIGRVLRTRLRSHALHASTRTAPQGGLLIAIVGPDGAGKSTLVRETTRWLSREVAVLPMYGGSGSGPASLPRRVVQALARLARPLARKRRPSRVGSGTAGPARLGGPLPTSKAEGRLRRLARAVWALSLARERRRNAARARRARDRGAVVLADRFPQSQFPGLNDGPKLSHWLEDHDPLLRWAARRERMAFDQIALSPPDLVVKLDLPFELALQRKPDTPTDQLRRKVEIVQALSFPSTTQVFTVDARMPLEEVLLAVKRLIWRAL
jgi:thymidylate kinase